MFAALVSYDAAMAVATDASLKPTVTAGVTATPLTRPGQNVGASVGRFRAAEWETGRDTFAATPAGAYITTADGAVAAGQYFQFSVTPTAGKRLKVDQVRLAPYLQTNPTRRTGNWAVQYRADNDDRVRNGNGGAWVMSDTYLAFQADRGVPLTSVATDDLANVQGAGVDFRIVIWNGMAWSAAKIGGIGGPEVIVDGDVATLAPPAPSAPAAPASLQVRSNLRSVANVLSWIDQSANESGFVIERATDASFSAGLTRFTVAANSTGFWDTSAEVGTSYRYRVQAVNASANAGSSFASDGAPHLTMEKLNPVMYGIAGANTGGPIRNVQTHWQPWGTTVTRATTANYFKGMTGDAFIMDVEDGQNAASADSMEMLKQLYPGKWVGSYGVTATDYYAPYFLEQKALGRIPLNSDPSDRMAIWNAADASRAAERNAANILTPSLYLLGTKETAAQYAADALLVKWTVQRAKALSPGKPVMPYVTLNTFDENNMSKMYAPMSIARWTNLMNALKAAGTDAVCLWSGGGSSVVPWVVTDKKKLATYPGWKPYAEVAEQVFKA